MNTNKKRVLSGWCSCPSLFLYSFLLLMLLFSSCKKFLDEKPDKKISTPETLDDLQGILDYYFGMNARYPSAGEVCADNYYLTDAGWGTSSELHRNYYTWQKYDKIGVDWNNSYNSIFYANVILYSLDKISIAPGEQQRANEIRGASLFVRASQHFALAQLFAPAYDLNTASKDLGIPLRLNTNNNSPSVRVSVQQNYHSILSDLTESLSLLPVLQPLKYRPGKPAAYALLARTCLVMQDYTKAGLYADSCLQLYDSLMNYNTLTASSTIPFRQFNTEVIYDTRTAAPSALSASRAKVDTGLYRSYEMNDIRRSIFFKSNSDGSKAFKGNYTGLSNASLFTGIATDEVYLIRAESFARNGNLTAAMKDINDLLRTRWKTINGVSTYIDKTAVTSDEALQFILTERRKELLYRTLRWSDLRRLNKESAYAITIYRTINNQLYQLSPGSPRYTLQIDRGAILFSGMEQNP